MEIQNCKNIEKIDNAFNQLPCPTFEKRLELLIKASKNGVWEWDRIHDIEYFSDRWMEISGYSREELGNNLSWLSFVHPDDKDKVSEALNIAGTNKNTNWICEYRIKTKSGKYKWVSVRSNAIFDTDGNMCWLSSIHSDITELKEYEEKLYKLAYLDSLTGLPNKASLEIMLSYFFNDSTPTYIALLHIGSDNLKYANDTLGVSFGDMLINTLAERLKTFENDQKILFRLGGDEFILLFCGYETLDDVHKLARRILKRIELPFEINRGVFRVTASIGISIYPDNGYNMEELMKCSGVAMHKARNTGKNKYSFYDKDMDRVILERMHIEKLLYSAVENEELLLFYQPQIDLKSGKISGFEALLRWNSPELGFVLPDKFIPISEDTHWIIPIGEWVLRKACSFCRSLHLKGMNNCTISVNVSIIQLVYSNFADKVLDILNQTGLEPKYLEIEITESILMQSYESVCNQLERLRAHGVNIALDDFGKGYSSLVYLKQLPINTLKIDKVFLKEITNCGFDDILTDLIIMTGKKLGFNIVAEGVETKEQLEYLIEKKCPLAQGYYFCKPISEEDAIMMIQENK